MSEAPAVSAKRTTEELAWIALVVTSALYFFLRNVADNDLWMHVFFGRRIITDSGFLSNKSDGGFSYTIFNAGWYGTWVNHEWLAQVLFGAVFDHLGSPGLILFKAACGFLTVWVLWRRLTANGLPFPAAAFVSVIVIAVLARGFAIRPQILTYLFLALTYEAIERNREGKPAMLGLWALLVVAWSNAHAGFVAGVCIMWGYLGWSVIVDGGRRIGRVPAALLGSTAAVLLFLFFVSISGATKQEKWQTFLTWLFWPLPAMSWLMGHTGLIGLLCFLAALIHIGSGILAGRTAEIRLLGAAIFASAVPGWSSAGFDLVRYLAYELSFDHPITEWAPVSLSDPAQLPFLVLGALFLLSTVLSIGDLRRHVDSLLEVAPHDTVSAISVRNLREHGWKLVIAAATFYMALRHQRHTALFAVCAAPAIGVADTRVKEIAGKLGPSAVSRLLVPALIVFSLLQLGLTAANLTRHSFRVVYESSDYPSGAVDYLRRYEFQGNIAVPLDWGNYVIWHLGPKVRVSLDGRFATLYGKETIEANFDLFEHRGERWTRLLDEWPTDAILAPHEASGQFFELSGWRAVYEDPVSFVFVRSENAIEPEKGAGPASPWLYFP